MKKRIILVLSVLAVVRFSIPASDIVIRTESDLCALSSGGDYDGEVIVLDADITLTSKWQPIGNATTPFRGEFDGNGHVISGLSIILGHEGVGLFGYVEDGAYIHDLGIANGRILAANKRYIGSLVGVLNGKVERCWSMATIQTAGSVVGGLVGYAQTSASITDCYNSGPIMQAKDTIGGLIGWNMGKITRAYNIGFAFNGRGFVGVNEGTLTSCYYDAQLYIQETQSMPQPHGLTAVDKTTDLMKAFASNNTWTTKDVVYPCLTKFKAHQAAFVSIAPLWMSIENLTPTNHANNISNDFKVSLHNGVQWSIAADVQEQWLKLVNDVVHVTFPCQKTDILMQVSLGEFVRDVYVMPKTLAPFNAGDFYADTIQKVFGNPIYFKNHGLRYQGITGGGGIYSFRLLCYQVVGTDTIFREVVLEETPEADYDDAIAAVIWTPETYGTWIIRQEAHDNACHVDWAECDGEWLIELYKPITPGKIPSDHLEFCGADDVSIYSIEDAVSDSRLIVSYVWTVNGAVIEGQKEASLVGYTLHDAGTYTFKRFAYDGVSATASEPLVAAGEVVVAIYNEFDAGEIDNGSITYCEKTEIDPTSSIYGYEAKGGKEPYFYQWYVSVDGGYPTEIVGAVDKNLDFGQIMLNEGHTYVFSRKTKDSYCALDWEDSEGKQEVRIYESVSPGRITNEIRDDVCINAEEVTNIHIHIDSREPAESDGSLEYIWYRSNESGSVKQIAVGEDKESLDITFPLSDINVGENYTFYRMVRNTECNGNLIRSSGQVTQRYVQTDRIDTTLTICESELLNGYTMYYPDSRNPLVQHTFTYEGEVWEFIDPLIAFCPSVIHVTLQTTPSPEIRIDPKAKVCQDEGTLTIYFEVLKGEPDSFYIELSPNLSQYFDGKKFIEGTLSPVSVGQLGYILLRNVKRIGMGVNYMNVQVGNRRSSEKSEVCFSDMHNVELEVNLGGYVYEKFGKVLFVDNEPDNEDKLKFKSYQWYKNGYLEGGQTGQYYQENGQYLDGIYYVMLTDINNNVYRSCDIIMNAPDYYNVSASTIYPTIVLPGETLTLQCDGEAAIISNGGQLVLSIGDIDGQTTVSAPSVSGFYTVCITDTSGNKSVHKLIVQ